MEGRFEEVEEEAFPEENRSEGLRISGEGIESEDRLDERIALRE